MQRWKVPWRTVWSLVLHVIVGQLLLADKIESAPAPCILQTNGALNETALSIYKAKGRFMDGVLYSLSSLTCPGLPATVCTDQRALSNGSRFCVVQLTGTCFCPISSLILKLIAPKSATLTADVLTRLALETKCLPDFYPSQPNCLGDQLCKNVTDTLALNPKQAKALIASLQLYYPSMKCIRSLAHNSQFNWTSDELMNLTRGLQSSDVSDILSLINLLKKNPVSSSDLSNMTGEALLQQPPSIIRNILAAITGPNKTSFLSQYTKDLQQAKTKILSLLGSSPTDRSIIDKLANDARRPSPTDLTVADVFRPLTNISASDIKVMLSDSTLVGCYGDSELKQVAPNIICNSISTGGSDPYANLTALQQRTIRELCSGSYNAKVAMPPSLVARASPTEITAECQGKTTFDALKTYFEQFSNFEYNLTLSQIQALQGCFDGAMTTQKYTGLDNKTISRIRVAMRHVPIELIQDNFKTQADRDNYCQQMSVGPFLNEQKRNVLTFCLNQTQVSVCDLNDLLNRLSTADVDRLSDDDLISCISVLGRKVSDPAARRSILDRYLEMKEGWGNLTGDDFKAIGCFATEITDDEVKSLKFNGNFGLVFPAFMKELFDQGVRVSVGEHGPTMQSLIDAAKTRIIPALLSASQLALGSRPSRKKRAATSGTITCPSVIAPSSWPVEQLNNLSSSVFTSCPSALNVDGYVNEQVSAVAQLAVQAVGDPCMWNRTYVQQLGVIVFGINVTSISCMDFNDSQTIASVGGRRTKQPLDAAKYQAVFNRWTTQTGRTPKSPMTAEIITTIGIVSCGMPTYVTMSATEYDKASKIIGGMDCYSQNVLKLFARSALSLYGNGSTIDISAVANIGTVIAGMDASFFRDLSPEKVSAIIPAAIWLIAPNIIANLTIDQIRAFTPAQAIALTDTQLQALNGTVLLDIIMQKRKMEANYTSTAAPSTVPPKDRGTAAGIEGPTTGVPPKNAAGTNGTMNGTAPPPNRGVSSGAGDTGNGNGSVTATNPKMNSNAFVSVAPGGGSGGVAPIGGSGGGVTGSGAGGTGSGYGGGVTGSGSGGSVTGKGSGGGVTSSGNGAGVTGSGAGGSATGSGAGGSVTGSGSGGGNTGKGSEVSTKQQPNVDGTGGSGVGPSTRSGALASNAQPAAVNPTSGSNRAASDAPPNAVASATPKPAGAGDASSAANPGEVPASKSPPAGDPSKPPPNQDTPPPTPKPSPIPALPAVIDKNNIMNFLSRLGADMSADDMATRLQPDALNSATVLQKLAAQRLTDNQKQVLSNKIEQLFAKPNAVVDPILLASAGPLVSPKIVRKITAQQVLEVVKQAVFQQNRETALLYGPRVGQLLTGISNAADFSARMIDCQKAVSGIPAVDFMDLIKNRPINNDSLVNFTDITFTERQARLLYAKFQSDNPSADASKMATSSLKNLIDTLPKCLRQAVQPDSVKNMDGLTAVDVILGVSSSHGFTQSVDPAASQGALPLEKRLFEKVKTYGFEKLDDKQLINLMSSGLLTVQAVKIIGSKLCDLTNLPSVQGFNLVFALSSPVLSAIYEICRPVQGAFCNGATDRYGLLSVGATPSDILAIKDDDALFNYCIPNICQMIHFASQAQIEALLTVVRAHLDKKTDLGDKFMEIDCLLPYLGARYLNQTSDYSKRDAICGLIACQPCVNVPSPILREAMDFCLSSGVSLKTFTCPVGRGRCLMEAMNKGYPSHSNVTCGPAAIDAVDLLQGAVMDCALRAELYGCVKDHLNLTDKNSLSQLGSLVDQFSDADWNSVPKKNLCGLLGLVSRVWAAWDYFQIVRKTLGLKPVALCTNRPAVLARLRAAEASTDCTGTTPTKRRKRDTTTLTCDQVNQMGSSVTQLSASELQTLSSTDFINCAQFLGRVVGFQADQWTALASVAKQAYGSDCSKWTTEQITSAAGIITGLTSDEISQLTLNDLTAIQAVGSNGLWSVDQLMKAFACVKKNYKNNNITSYSSAELSSLSNIICGATGDEINSLQAKEVCGAIEDIGQLHTCEDQQLQALANQEKVCLGSDVTKWTASDVESIGSVIGGLSKADIPLLSQAQIEAISVSTIPEISPILFSGFTAAQLDYFSTYQVAVMTSAQYDSLDESKQAVVKKKLSSVSDDVSLSPSARQGGKSACSPLSASLLPLLTAPLAFLLRI